MLYDFELTIGVYVIKDTCILNGHIVELGPAQSLQSRVINNYLQLDEIFNMEFFIDSGV